MGTITLSPADAQRDQRAAILTCYVDGLIDRHWAHRELRRVGVLGDFQPSGERVYTGFDSLRGEWVEFRP